MSKKLKSLLKRHVSVTRAAQLLNVSTATIWRWLKRGVRGRRLKSFLLGGRRRIFAEELRRFVAPADAVRAEEAAVVERKTQHVAIQLDELLNRRRVQSKKNRR